MLQMFAKIFTYPLTIKEAHLDTFGHVNNAAYLTLFEEARWDLITKNGYGLEKMLSTGIGPTILEINLTFLKEIRLREEIVITTQMILLEKKIGKLSQKMLRNDEICCVATFVFGLFDLHKRKLIPPTPEWLTAIGCNE
jgi:thioesterase-3